MAYKHYLQSSEQRWLLRHGDRSLYTETAAYRRRRRRMWGDEEEEGARRRSWGWTEGQIEGSELSTVTSLRDKPAAESQRIENLSRCVSTDVDMRYIRSLVRGSRLLSAQRCIGLCFLWEMKRVKQMTNDLGHFSLDGWKSWDAALLRGRAALEAVSRRLQLQWAPTGSAAQTRP